MGKELLYIHINFIKNNIKMYVVRVIVAKTKKCLLKICYITLHEYSVHVYMCTLYTALCLYTLFAKTNTRLCMCYAGVL